MAATEEETRPNPTPATKNPPKKDQALPSLDNIIATDFSKLWRNAVDDNYLTLYGFRRYRTSHLINLRFLEAEIDKLDRIIFQAGLNLDYLPILDRLGLKHARRDASSAPELVDESLVLQLRGLLKQYDDALVSFNCVMAMETFSLYDNSSQSNARNDLNPYEAYKTRLIRVDLAPRNNSRDPIQHYLRKGLRRLWYSARSAGSSGRDEESGIDAPASKARAVFNRSYQNTARVAELATRFLIALCAGFFLVVPLVVLSLQDSKTAHLVTVSICIIVLSLLVSLLSKASNYETIAASAAYAAVLAVFIST